MHRRGPVALVADHFKGSFGPFEVLGGLLDRPGALRSGVHDLDLPLPKHRRLDQLVREDEIAAVVLGSEHCVGSNSLDLVRVVALGQVEVLEFVIEIPERVVHEAPFEDLLRRIAVCEEAHGLEHVFAGELADHCAHQVAWMGGQGVRSELRLGPKGVRVATAHGLDRLSGLLAGQTLELHLRGSLTLLVIAGAIDLYTALSALAECPLASSSRLARNIWSTHDSTFSIGALVEPLTNSIPCSQSASST